MAAKLKVYATRIGFHDAVVAAANQKAALAAWGVQENLFAQGAARVTDDTKAIKAATAHPGVVLRRAAGSDGPFSETPGAPAVPEIKRPGRTKAEKPAKEAPPKPPPDRSALDAAEKALADLAEADKRRRADLARRREDLDAEERTAAREHDRRRTALERERDRARRAFEGG